MPQAIPLPSLGAIAVTGPESTAFLQGQLTQDVLGLEPGRALLAGWCDPKGRLRWAGPVCALAPPLEPGFALVAPAAMTGDLARELSRFLFRTKARVSPADFSITGLMGDGAGEFIAADSLNLPWPGDDRRRMLLGPPAGSGSVGATTDGVAWALADIQAGIPLVLPGTSGEFVPQMLNLDLLGGISFSKGCYTGQEIVARTRYLGRVKRRMLRFIGPGRAPAPGSLLHGTTGTAGQVVQAADSGDSCELLAVMVLDQLAGPVFLDAGHTRPLVRQPLPYDIPELAIRETPA